MLGPHPNPWKTCRVVQTPVPVGGPPRLPGTSGGPAGPGAMDGMFFVQWNSFRCTTSVLLHWCNALQNLTS